MDLHLTDHQTRELSRLCQMYRKHITTHQDEHGITVNMWDDMTYEEQLMFLLSQAELSLLG
jgi:hypothetical protein